MVLPSWRPMVISSRTRGTTVFLPSSSSMMSFISLPDGVHGQGPAGSAPNAHPRANARLDGRSEFPTPCGAASGGGGGAVDLGCSVGDSLPVAGGVLDPGRRGGFAFGDR